MSFSLHRFALFRLCAQVRFRQPNRVRVEPGVHLRRGSVVDARGGSVVLERGVWVGPDVSLLTGENRDDADSEVLRSGPIAIGLSATLEKQCIVIGPVRIGAQALVGAGALVTEDVADGAIVAGVPARAIGHRGPDGTLEFFSPRPRPTPPV